MNLTQNRDLFVAPCTFDAANFSVMNYHYSRAMPSGKLVKLGVWEKGEFIGAVIFGRGANNRLAQSFNLKQTECVELVRVALNNKKVNPTSKIVSIALRILKKVNPGIRIVVSYADMAQNHYGIIYQATNWLYMGESLAEKAINPKTGKAEHTRSLNSKFGSIKGFKRVKDKPKHKYVYLFDKRLTIKTKSYPMRQSNSGSSASSQETGGGSIPTLALQNS